MKTTPADFEAQARVEYRGAAKRYEGAALATLHDNIKADVVSRATSSLQQREDKLTVAGSTTAVLMYVGWKLETDTVAAEWTLLAVVRNGALTLVEMGRPS